MEHTQSNAPCTEKVTIFFHYTSNFLGIFSEFTFSINKNLNDWYECLVYSNFSQKLEKNEISKLHEEWKISPSQLPKKRSKVQKMGVLFTHSPKIPSPSPNFFITPNKKN